jgi:hypothetical protein
VSIDEEMDLNLDKKMLLEQNAVKWHLKAGNHLGKPEPLRW